MRSVHATGGVSLCDTILSHVELLQSLIIKKCDLTGVTLSSFSDPQKARYVYFVFLFFVFFYNYMKHLYIRQLRDKLILEDRMKMAIDVATKCNIESEPVWAAWGIALLELGRYPDAKEKFKYCLSTFSLESCPSLTHLIISILFFSDFTRTEGELGV